MDERIDGFARSCFPAFLLALSVTETTIQKAFLRPYIVVVSYRKTGAEEEPVVGKISIVRFIHSTLTWIAF